MTETYHSKPITSTITTTKTKTTTMRTMTKKTKNFITTHSLPRSLARLTHSQARNCFQLNRYRVSNARETCLYGFWSSMFSYYIILSQYHKLSKNTGFVFFYSFIHPFIHCVVCFVLFKFNLSWI